MSDHSSPQYISPAQLREIFNRGGYVRKLMTGELRQVTLSSWPAPRMAQQTEGTVSAVVEYRDAHGHRIALVHQYVRPDGTLGGSGLPDPKALIHEGVLYLLAPPGNDAPST